ncbi:MAG: DUF6268 family outer membrane beta-barrel protein [Flavobacteriales bacterium]
MINFLIRIVLPKGCAILFFIQIVNFSYAQELKLAGVSFAHYPKSEMKNGGGNQETAFNEFGAFINVPWKLKNGKTALINGLGYGFVEANMYNYQSFQTKEFSRKLQLIYYQFSLVHKWNKKWALVVNMKPTIASDFDEKISGDDFVFQGAVFATRTFSDKFKLGGGLVSTIRWGTPVLLPIVNFEYKYKKHKIKGVLPVSTKYTYSLLPNKKLNLGLKYARNGATFNILSKDFSEINKVSYSRANIGGLVNYQLTKLLRLEVNAGISTGRIYNLVNENKNVSDFNSKAAPFFSFGIALVPPKKEK